MPKSAIKKDPIVQQCVIKINDFIEKSGISKSELARLTGVTQPQVSKILGDRLKKENPDFIKLCQYAKIKYPPSLKDPLKDKRIQAAISKVWDGRTETIDLIVGLLECAALANNHYRR